MNPLLRALGFARKAETQPRNSELQGKLPEIHAFVDIAIGGCPVRESVPINNVTAKAIVIRRLDGLEPGTAADLLYTNSGGRYRFRTVCAKNEGDEAFLDLPESIKTIEQFSARRTAERIAWVTQVQWRFAPDGVGFGDFMPASMMDVSRGGVSLVVGREIKLGTQVEVSFMLNSKRKPFVEVCKTVRAAKIGTSDKHGVGLRFLTMDRQHERLLIQALEERRLLRRQRGVV
jgi:c-di-GMP-binding flagellar brake protein YcgR